MKDKEVANLLRFHEVKPEQRLKMEMIRDGAIKYAGVILELTPETAEQTLAIRALHVASMHAVSAIAIHEEIS